MIHTLFLIINYEYFEDFICLANLQKADLVGGKVVVVDRGLLGLMHWK